jgi:hypothetical protein
MRVRNHLLLVVALGASPAVVAAQTGRIAVASHAGRVADDADNFGIPPARVEYLTDSLVYQNDTLLMYYGRVRSARYNAGDEELKKKPWQPNSYLYRYYSGRYSPQRWEAATAVLRRDNPEAKLVGFDKPRQRPRVKKPTGRSQILPKRPFQYSYWRGLASVVALGAVGWLLGRKPEAKIR